MIIWSRRHDTLGEGGKQAADQNNELKGEGMMEPPAAQTCTRHHDDGWRVFKNPI